jgi:hypothetical protein
MCALATEGDIGTAVGCSGHILECLAPVHLYQALDCLGAIASAEARRQHKAELHRGIEPQEAPRLT